jgi:ribonuclease HII
MPNFEIENSFSGIIAGIDEAGRGPWCGPVTASAVIINQEKCSTELISLLNDSKKLSKKKRDMIYELLIEEEKSGGVIIGVGESTANEIDEINILQATFLAMKRAYQNLSQKPKMLLIDGNKIPQNLDIEAKAIVKGDSLSNSIAAASIIAKVTRDNQMEELAKEFPEYGWENNAGYGTKAHIEAIEKFGITEHHRKSYKPIAKYL